MPDRTDPPAGRSETEWIAAVAAANAGGDYLQGFDLASRALDAHPCSAPLIYARLLNLARVGATRRAEIELARLDAGGVITAIADPRLRADFLALRGRLLKDHVIRASEPSERKVLAARAAAAYAEVFAQGGGCFVAVNAATLWRVAGDPEKAAAMARLALDAAVEEADEYWRLASEGEAWIHLGDVGAAARSLTAAAAVAGGRLDAVASTRRQLDWLARVAGVGAEALAAMPAPRVLHWVAGEGEPAQGPVPSGGLRLVAFGSLLSGADVAVAENLRRDGAELNLVLPCAADVCRGFLVAGEGEAVGARFDALLAAARNVTLVTDEGDPGELTVTRLAIEQARGQAQIRAAALATTAEVLVVGDAGRADGPGRAPRTDASIWSRRRVRALVFGDIKGFSTISEAQHPAFFATVLGGFAAALAPLGAKVEYAETAGDGIYVVLSDVVAAVAACHSLQRAVDPDRLAAAGLSRGMGLRLSAHLGPVFPGVDPVTGREKFFGREVVRTARIEPVTPMGETYVTEQFASSLACAAGDRYACEYVGRQSMAKGFGECRMYSLRALGAGRGGGQ